MAIAALVLGICGFVTFGYTGLMAVPLAIAALVAISRAHQRGIAMGGKGMAITGLVVGGVSLLLLGTVFDGTNDGSRNAVTAATPVAPNVAVPAPDGDGDGEPAPPDPDDSDPVRTSQDQDGDGADAVDDYDDEDPKVESADDLDEDGDGVTAGDDYDDDNPKVTSASDVPKHKREGTWLRIITTECWSGSINNATKDGCGSQTIKLKDVYGIGTYAANAQKQGGGSGKLALELWSEGSKADSGSTTSPYGIVQVVG